VASNKDLFKRLARLFKSGPVVKKKVRNWKSPTASSAMDIFKKTYNQSYSSAINAYGYYDRLSRYSDYSEMEYTPEIASALDIYSDEATSQDDKGSVLHVHSENSKIRSLLDELFYDTLNINFHLNSWVRHICKYGDFFLFNDVSAEHGLINVFPIPVNEIEREEGHDPEDPLAVRFRWTSQGNQELENWQVTHFRLLGNEAFLPYGTSILESARRIWRQLILIEDAMLVYRVIRSPERRVFYIDVGNVPPEDIQNYMEQAKATLKSSQVIDKKTGRVDLRYNPLPVWKDTPIPLLDGRTVTIEQLSKEVTEGKESWVYSIQDDTHQIVPGKVVWCGKNYTAERMIKVWLDDDTFVMTAPEHPFVMRDGTSKRADELSVGDSLMPLYRKMSSVEEGDWIKDYEKTYNPATETFVYTHKLSADDFYAAKGGYTVKARRVIHHVDYNKHNNEPTNLQEMSYTAHRKHHAKHCQFTLNTPELLEARRVKRVAYNKSAKKRKKTAEDNRKYQKAQKMGAAYNGSDLHRAHNEIRKAAQLRSWAKNKEARSAAMKMVLPNECVDIVIDTLRQDHSLNRDRLFEVVRNLESFRAAWEAANSHNSRKFERYGPRTFAYQIKDFGYTGFADFKKSAVSGYKNHKVARIEEVYEPDDVYCMTVVGAQGEADRHNFAVLGIDKNGCYNTSGIFVQNSVDEDYFLPIRGSESGTKIETLAGGTNVSAIEDVEYIQKKLFSSLKVPKAYLGYDEALSSKATLAQEDIRFSRTINKIQRVVLAELNKLATIHLFANGYTGDDLIDFELQLSNPSTIAQQQKLELYRSKFEIAGTAPEGVLSIAWIQKNIFDLSTEEAESIREQQENDKLRSLKLEGLTLPEEAGGEELAGEEPLPGEEDTAAEEEPVDEPPEESLTASYENEDNTLQETENDDEFSIDDVDAPIKAQEKIKRVKYNQGRRKNNRRDTLVLPDFRKMVSMEDNDVNDLSFMKTLSKNPLKNPFKEASKENGAKVLNEFFDNKIKENARMTDEVKSVLKKLDSRINNNNNDEFKEEDD
jgi:hypothetical protein